MIGRVALRYSCVEAVRGDIGWSTFIESVKGNITYRIRLERMENATWAKSV